MTEHEWQNSSDPHAMLEFLRLRGKADARKERLFAVACSRRIWALIDPLGRAAIEIAEEFADGLTDPDVLRAARRSCQGASGQSSWYAAATNPEIAARNAARSAQAGVAGNPLLGAEAGELVAQADLLRDIFGPLPFRELFFDAPWRTQLVVEVAQAIYQERTFDRMPELADALQAAACHNEEILSHCRQPKPHVRGCFVVDMILDKG